MFHVSRPSKLICQGDATERRARGEEGSLCDKGRTGANIRGNSIRVTLPPGQGRRSKGIFRSNKQHQEPDRKEQSIVASRSRGSSSCRSELVKHLKRNSSKVGGTFSTYPLGRDRLPSDQPILIRNLQPRLNQSISLPDVLCPGNGSRSTVNQRTDSINFAEHRIRE